MASHDLSKPFAECRPLFAGYPNRAVTVIDASGRKTDRTTGAFGLRELGHTIMSHWALLPPSVVGAHIASQWGIIQIQSHGFAMEGGKRNIANASTVIPTLVIALSAFLTGCNGDGGTMGTPSTSETSSKGVQCSDYSSQAAAQAAHNRGIKGLDADGDGIACEDLK